MKKILSCFAALSLSACTPAVADPEIKEWNTYNSMGCMMLRECKEGTEPILSWVDLGTQYKPWADELNNIFSAMGHAGIGAYVADDKYFVTNTRGLYDVQRNNFFLNTKYLDDPQRMVSVIRHEAWHAVQDCMAGTLDNTFTAVVWPDGKIPDWVNRGAKITYETNPKAIPYEAEAMYAAMSNHETSEALQVCADPLKEMWDVYPTTPKTKEWLTKNGFIR